MSFIERYFFIILLNKFSLYKKIYKSIYKLFFYYSLLTILKNIKITKSFKTNLVKY